MSTHLPYGGSIPMDMDDAAIYELALARNSATWMPSNASNSRRPRSSRITKPGSAGNSPQRMPRRRTTASHKSAKYRSDLYPQSAFTTQHAPNVPASQTLPAAATTRPVSWHPSSMMSNGPGVFPNYQTHVHRLSIGDYPSVDNSIPNSLPHASIGSFDGWFSFEDSTPKLPYEISRANTSPYGSISDEPLYSYPIGAYGQTSYPVASLPPSMTTQATSISPHDYAIEAFPSMPPTSFYSTTAFTAPTTPDAFPIQQPSDPLVGRSGPAADVTTQSSGDAANAPDNEPELIGMGLYDLPAQTSFLFEEPNSPTSQGSPPMGKGLKLEETWEPPSASNSDLDSEDDADGEDDDDALSDDMDTAFESSESLPSATLNLPFQHPEPILAPKPVSPLDPPEAWSPPQDDLAGRSFYMDDGSPVTLDHEAAQMWMVAMMTHTGVGTAMAT